MEILMKRKIIRLAALALAIITLILPIASCSSATRPAVSLGNNSISVGMYSLMASILKGSLAYGNSSVNGAAYWETVADKESGKTNEQVYGELLLESAKNNLYKLAMFDEKGLTLPDSVMTEIDEELAFWVDYDGEGSMNNFNDILSQYGANYDILRDYMIMSAKLEYLVTYMYGDGSKIGDGVKQEYLEESYLRVKQIFFPYYEYLYESDKYGDDIYYTSDGKIAYDPENKDAITADADGDGNTDRDKNGDVIWYIDDKDGNPHICYDTALGTRKNRYDENGNPITSEYNKAEKGEIWSRADDVLKSTENGNFNGFEALMLIYDESYGTPVGADKTEDSVYLNKDITYTAIYGDKTVDDLKAAADKLAVGEIARVETEHGVHLIMRYELEDKAWDLEANEGYFEDDTGITDFDQLLINYLFTAEIEKYKEKLGEVTVDTEAIAGVSLKNIGTNYDFY